MDYYDGRCRDYYIEASKTKDPIFYGPYLNPSLDHIFLVTHSVAVYKAGKFYGVLNKDINLQIKQNISESIGIDMSKYSYFIADNNKKPLAHSDIKIMSQNITLVDLVFLDEEVWLIKFMRLFRKSTTKL